MRCPVDYIGITQKYSKLGHNGIDFGWHTHNCPIYAIDDGEVIYNRYQKSGGYVIIIKHPNGFCSVYGHLLKDSQKVHEGDKVKKGQQIAQMGKSGQVTGEHLHLSIYKGNRVMLSKTDQLLYYKDPLKYLNVYDGQTLAKASTGLTPHTKKVTAMGGLNIRTAPNTKGKIVGVAQYGEQVETYGLKNGWNIVDNILFIKR